MSKYLVDSNVIIAFFRKEEEDYGSAEQLLSEMKGFVVSDYVLSEVVTILRLKEGVKIAAKAASLLKWNQNVDIIQVNNFELEETLHCFLRSKKNISFVDASLIVLSKKRNLKLVTFDKDLLKSIK